MCHKIQTLEISSHGNWLYHNDDNFEKFYQSIDNKIDMLKS